MAWLLLPLLHKMGLLPVYDSVARQGAHGALAFNSERIARGAHPLCYPTVSSLDGIRSGLEKLCVAHAS